MVRSSLRLQAQRQASAQTKRTHDEASDDGNDDLHDQKRARVSRKRATGKRNLPPVQEQGSEPRTTARKVPADQKFKRVRGKLGLLHKLVTDVPMDVIFEIFSHLQPHDILRLARTSKDLRNILMSKSSESIWRSARANVEGLPPLPHDLSEPQYANLMFESHCHNCLSKARCDNVSWEYRMRCCADCQPDVFFGYRTTMDYVHRGGVKLISPPHKTQRLLPTYRPRVVPKSRIRWDLDDLYIPSVVKQYYVEYTATLNDEDERAKWIVQRAQDCNYVREHALLCEEWYKTQLKHRANEQTARRVKRREDIFQRLDEIGLGEEARRVMSTGQYTSSSRRDMFSKLKSVNKTAKLTAPEWERIKEPLIDLVERHKAERLTAQKSSALEIRYTSLKTMYAKFCEKGDGLRTPLPSLGDIFASELFDHIIWGTPFDKYVNDSDFRQIFDEVLPAFVDEWRQARERELLDMLFQELPSATLSESDLRLATCIFECADCTEKYWYPAIFNHCCWRHYSGRELGLSQYQLKYVEREVLDPFRRFNTYPWSSQFIKFNVKNWHAIRVIVEGCGLDPAIATPDDLGKADPMIECKTCQSQSAEGTEVVFPWRYAFTRHVEHEISVVKRRKDAMKT